MLFRNRTLFTAVAISATLFAAAAGLAAEKEAGVFRISDQSPRSGASGNAIQPAGYESPVFRANWDDDDDDECDCEDCKKERRHKLFSKLCPFHHHHCHGCYTHGGMIGWLFHCNHCCKGGNCGRRRRSRLGRRIFGQGDQDEIEVQYRGVGGEGLFGAGCELDPYRAQCDQTRLARMFHDTACDWNAEVYKRYRDFGTGSGYYRIAYPVNTQHIDPRDGRIYATEVWGIPMAVPVAPNVTHTYNYGWGIPSSRLSPMSYPAPEMVPVPAAPGAAGGAKAKK